MMRKTVAAMGPCVTRRLFSLPTATAASRLMLNQPAVLPGMPMGFQQVILRRSLVTKAPGNDPLEVLRQECISRNLCDKKGYRLPGVHWVLAVAISPPHSYNSVNMIPPPNLRTIGVQRVSPRGIEFVMKKGSKTADSLSLGQSISVLFSQGKYVPGESAEQWRAEGECDPIPLSEVLHCVPHYTLTGMIVSKRMEQESMEKSEDMHENVSADRLAMLNRSHVTEISQRTRLELENNQISVEELEQSIQAFRFCPDRVERMQGGPDSVLWERWEWIRSPSGDLNDTTIEWNEPSHLLPH